ncbi:ribosomal protein L4 [Hymenopellis radicata]|nr:ribosomal protein L4 [Hymenopellis radicata]
MCPRDTLEALLVIPIAPVYVELTAPFLPQPTDPKPSETILALDPTVFRHPVRRDILHLCIVHHRDATRQGSASTKTRGEVAGSGKKIRPQKGSGRARLGDAQSPMLRGGGVAFGPKPRDFSTKLPRKVIDMGMRVALSLKVKENEFGVMSQMQWDLPKTGLLTKRLEELRLSETLFVTGAEQVPDALRLAIRNIPKVTVMPVKELKVFDLLKWRRLVLDTQAVDALEHNLARQPPRATAAAL